MREIIAMLGWLTLLYLVVCVLCHFLGLVGGKFDRNKNFKKQKSFILWSNPWLNGFWPNQNSAIYHPPPIFNVYCLICSSSHLIFFHTSIFFNSTFFNLFEIEDFKKLLT